MIAGKFVKQAAAAINCAAAYDFKICAVTPMLHLSELKIQLNILSFVRKMLDASVKENFFVKTNDKYLFYPLLCFRLLSGPVCDTLNINLRFSNKEISVDSLKSGAKLFSFS